MPKKILCTTTLALASALLAGHASAQDSTATSSGAATASATLPDGFEVLDRYVEAIGGEEAYRKHKTEQMTGQYSMPAMGIQGPIVIKRAATTKTLINIQVPPFGEVIQGTNGEEAWGASPDRPMTMLEGAEADKMINEANFYAIVEPRKTYTSAETVGTVTFAGVECYKVNVVTSWGEHQVCLFEVESGLHRKVSTRESTETDVFTNEITYSDFRDADGIKRPFRMAITTAAMMGAEQVIQFETIEFGVEFEEGTFDPPGSL